jgi:hypothetical protein
MRIGLSLTLAGVLCCYGFATRVEAQTITFDELGNDGSSGTPIPDGYEGLDWTNFDVLNTPDYTVNFGPNGYANGTVSNPNIAYNNFGNPASFGNSSTSFNFGSADFTAAWRDGLTINAKGLNQGVVIDNTTFTVDTSEPTLEVFDWTGVDTVEITSSGGTPHGYVGNTEQVAIDNISLVVPEPGTWAILAMGCALLFAFRRWARL